MVRLKTRKFTIWVDIPLIETKGSFHNVIRYAALDREFIFIAINKFIFFLRAICGKGKEIAIKLLKMNDIISANHNHHRHILKLLSFFEY